MTPVRPTRNGGVFFCKYIWLVSSYSLPLFLTIKTSHIMEKFEALLKQLVSLNPYHMESHPQGVIVPIYWSEDKDGNVNFDTESIREEFESLLYQLETHNDESEFDWDNC